MLPQFKKEDLNFIDIETKSFVDLPESGLQAYANHESTGLICLVVLDWWGKEKIKWQTGGDLKELQKLRKLKGLFISHNYQFEFHILNNVFGNLLSKDMKNLDNWLCTMNLAYRLGLHGRVSLDHSAKFFQTKVQKKVKLGKDLIKTYSLPIKNKKTGHYSFRSIPPKDLKLFLQYCKDDVRTMIEVFKAEYKLLSKHCSKTDNQREHKIFSIYKGINNNGLKIDLKNATKVITTINLKRNWTEKEAVKKYGTAKGGGVIVKSSTGFKDWLNERLSKKYCVDNSQAGTLAVLKDDLGKLLKVEKNSVKKGRYKQILNALEARSLLSSQVLNKIERFSAYDLKGNETGLASKDGVVQNIIQYYGAGTGRGAGRGLQPHNIYAGSSKKFFKPLSELSKLKGKKFVDAVKLLNRQLIVPHKKGNVFYIGDLKAIEARLQFWLVGSKKWLDAFTASDKGEGPEPYIIKACEVYNKNEKSITKDEREVGKVLMLSAGYGLSATRLHENLYDAGLTPKQELIIQWLDNKGKKKKKVVKISIDSEFAGLQLHSSKFISGKGLLLVAFKKGFEIFERVLEIPLVKSKYLDLGEVESSVGKGNIRQRLPSSISQLTIQYNFECGKFIKEHRDSLPELIKAWQILGKAFKECFQHQATLKNTLTKEIKFPFATVIIKSVEKFILIVLPSGRTVFYTKEGMDINHYYGAKIFQNIIQCLARDVLMEAIIRVVEGKNKFSYRMDVHDEIVCEGPNRGTYHRIYLDSLIAYMEKTPLWAKGLVVKAEGEVSKRYKKI